MMIPRSILASSLALAILLPACALHHRTSDEELVAAAEAPSPIVLEVENHNWADVVLYIVHDGTQTRFAQVAAAHDLSVEIPATLQGEMRVIRLAARRIGGTDSFLSPEISLRGGSAVRFTIESSLARSSVGVW